jgi:hypothetical protein
MKGKKVNELERAEELGREIISFALDQKKEILRKVDEDVQKELEHFKKNLPQEEQNNLRSI